MNINPILRKPVQYLYFFFIATLVTIISFGVGYTSIAHVEAFTVTKTADTNDGACDTDCSLREAIIAANASPGDDTIILPGDAYTLTISGNNEDAALTGDLDITDDLTLEGAGAMTTIIDGGALDRILHVTSAFTVTISGITIRNGNVEGAGGGIYVNSGSNLAMTILTDTIISGNNALNGGGVSMPNGGTLTLTNSTVSDNSTTGVGGGIQNYDGIVTIVNSTISNNTADSPGGGGGIYNYAGSDGGIVTLVNSTVSGNTSTDSNGGGIVNYFFGGTVNLRSTTIANNIGGGVANSSISTVNASNTIIAGNTGFDCSGTLTSQGYNLIQSSCTITGTTTGNLIGVSPDLGPLQNNGGPTLVHAMLTGSPAIDAGNNIDCPATDQRGFPRPMDGNNDGMATCDIGAYEYEYTNFVYLPVILSN